MTHQWNYWKAVIEQTVHSVSEGSALEQRWTVTVSQMLSVW